MITLSMFFRCLGLPNEISGSCPSVRAGGRSGARGRTRTEKDAIQVLGLMWPSCFLIFPDGASRGLDAIRARFCGHFSFLMLRGAKTVDLQHIFERLTDKLSDGKSGIAANNNVD